MTKKCEHKVILSSKSRALKSIKSFSKPVKGPRGFQGNSGQCLTEVFDSNNTVLINNVLVPSTADGNLIIGPTGNGFLAGQLPTPGNISGGECRGAYAVDFQLNRNDPSQVALGVNSFIGAGSNNISSGTYSTIVAGNNNQLSGPHSFIGSGKNNLIETAEYAFIGSGQNNSITGASDYAVIVGGSGNTNHCIRGAIGAGMNNKIFNTEGGLAVDNTIMGGSNNKINGYVSEGGGSIIGGGENNYLAAYDQFHSIIGGADNVNKGWIYTNIMGGKGNVMRGITYFDDGFYGFMGGGKNNRLESIWAGWSMGWLVGGENNGTRIGTYNNSYNYSCRVVGGKNNTWDSPSQPGYIYNGYGYILGGKNNCVIGVAEFSRRLNPAICGGINNIIQKPYNYGTQEAGELIMSGSNNYHLAANGAILGGNQNRIESHKGYNVLICGGENNKMIGVNIDSCIVGGADNNIEIDPTNNEYFYCTIGGGRHNTITGSAYFADGGTILGGKGNIISGERTVILGGQDNQAHNYASIILGGEGLVSPDSEVNGQILVGRFNDYSSTLATGSNERLFVVGRGDSDTSRENLMSVDTNGNCFLKGSLYQNTTADYAEYFEALNGEEIPSGTSVVLEKSKIREALPGENPLGVISQISGIRANAYQDGWHGKYKKNEFGGLIRNKSEPILSELYDDGQEYVPRSKRPEWNLVGLLGQIYLRKGQVTGKRWVKMQDFNNTYELWFVR